MSRTTSGCGTSPPRWPQPAAATSSCMRARRCSEGCRRGENREVPPLRYDVVQRLRREFPRSGSASTAACAPPSSVAEALGWADGVMLGREAYHRPAGTRRAAPAASSPTAGASGCECVARAHGAYAEREVAAGEHAAAITRHMLGLQAGRPGARQFRQLVSEGARGLGAGPAAAAGVRRLLREAGERLAA